MRTSKLFDINSEDKSFLYKDIFIVKTEWNSEYVDVLAKDCEDTLRGFGVQTIHTRSAPGSIELIYKIRQLSKRYKIRDIDFLGPEAVFIALGCVVRGETPHFDYVCQYVTQGICALNLELPAPTIFGIITADMTEQVEARVFGKEGYKKKGEEFALTAIRLLQDSSY